MNSQSILLSPKYREATFLALALQIPSAMISLLLLDGGWMAKVCGIAMLGFWGAAAIIAVRRPWRPTNGDLIYWKWGFPGCFAMTILGAVLAGNAPFVVL